MNDFPDFSNYGYQITRELGHNRAGGRVTYLATEINTKRSVVVKQFQFAQTGANWAEYQAYEKEIQILRALDNPNIPRYLDSFQTASGFCMVQEYKDANSLATSPQQTPQKTKQIAISVLEILKYLQNRVPPVIHRDLKPENILVDDRLNVSLVDFGFARIGGGEVAASSVVKGTLGFMPPEQMFNRQLTVASDLYSLGATLICLLIGINSTEIGSLMDDTGPINFKHRLPQLTPEFLDWLQKMVEPNFKHRYPSADAALNALIPLEVVQQRNKSKLALISVGLLTAIAAIFIPLLWKFPEPQTAANLKRIINAVKLNPQTQVMLTDELESKKTRDVWSLKQKKKVYFSVSATNLPEGKYRSYCKVVNPEGLFAAQSQSYLKTTGDRLNTWCWYNFKQDDKPGNWQFQFYLDGQKVTQNSFKVLH
ncbi:MAG: serine/threonine protein kinase [Microcoleus sp. PH2017_25_DOB_D_A]|uniref:serine/threonine protein kinase n=1 Tax=unclassified Microcoleus TaxID=2642155 RepID=UPI001E0C9DD8|nr:MULTISPECIES: serine/threonine-protein kinase [unclassified Microcoleus]TAE10849.1 MAG: serine/threonine protein kinase [Oscillatoriales cyanobacterium]MCC3448783.1 serine/threonine protein kinase [Microcoleus sp. PH2017_09_SFU_O_A]MCC3491929.1 serine/threonine protein kinase [Microcoleus sp. PH2017_16_JOR_D_A]MCC3535867.1 serine/threonine protein kinase [Microcoleus sp. PH2017_25_DOB_D_A]MCC3548100.1 serine/threonine protein kinase [Microcoleus sp. PH2017_24_DOB_U_A]